MSREHVQPRWLRRLFPEVSEVDYVRFFQRSGGDLQEHSRPGRVFDQTVRDFCEKCNTGWMAQLETDVEPLLSSMILGEPRSVDAVAQALIATWATKTILTTGPTSLGGEQVATTEQYLWFGRTQAPLPGSLVWLGRYVGEEDQWPVSFHVHGMTFLPVDEPEPREEDLDHGFHSVFAIGQLVFCVFVADVPPGPIATGGSGESRVLIWPATGETVWWPPPKSFATADELRRESRLTPDGVAPPLPTEDL